MTKSALWVANRYAAKLHYTSFIQTIKLAGVAGLEPTTFGFGDRRSTN